jgi:L-glyceraldehyde 3-phosphate reductase
MLHRDIEQEFMPVARQNGVGIVAFSVLGQGLLSNRYLNGVPEGSRAARTWTPEQREQITPALQEKIRQLEEIAKSRGQTLPQMAIAWTLRHPEISSALIGASDADQIDENVKALEKLDFTDDDFRRIDTVLQGASI